MKNKFNINSNRFGNSDALSSVLSSESTRLTRLSPEDIDTWVMRDRKDFELGDIDDLLASIINRGQAQPIIVVKSDNVFKPKSNYKAKYIVIAGYRRWLACSKGDLKVDAIVKQMTFDQAVKCLKSENEKESVSEYSMGMFYHKLKSDYGYTLDKLSKNLGVSLSQLYRLLTFAEVPNSVWEAIGDIKNVSARTSAEMLSLIKKNEDGVEFLLEIAEKIKNGAGAKTIQNLFSTWKKDEMKTSHDKEAVSFTKTGIIKVDTKMFNIGAEEQHTLLAEIELLMNKYRRKHNE
mgnify:CR=1 FL=1